MRKDWAASDYAAVVASVGPASPNIPRTPGVPRWFAQTLAISSRAYLIENGLVAMQGPADELARDPELRRNYLGL